MRRSRERVVIFSLASVIRDLRAELSGGRPLRRRALANRCEAALEIFEKWIVSASNEHNQRQRRKK
jgi:hypothetical protein